MAGVWVATVFLRGVQERLLANVDLCLRLIDFFVACSQTEFGCLVDAFNVLDVWLDACTGLVKTHARNFVEEVVVILSKACPQVDHLLVRHT